MIKISDMPATHFLFCTKHAHTHLNSSSLAAVALNVAEHMRCDYVFTPRAQQ